MPFLNRPEQLLQVQICQQTEIQKQPTYPALKLTQMGRKFILNFYENMLKDLTKKKKKKEKTLVY